MSNKDPYAELVRRIRGFALEDGIVTRTRVHSAEADRDTIVSTITWTAENASGRNVMHTATFHGSYLASVTVGFTGSPQRSLNRHHFDGKFTKDLSIHFATFDIQSDLDQYL